MIIGVDLGGTNFKAGLVSDGNIILEAYNSVHRDASKSELIQTLFKTIDEVFTENVKGIGVGVPGVGVPGVGVPGVGVPGVGVPGVGVTYACCLKS